MKRDVLISLCFFMFFIGYAQTKEFVGSLEYKITSKKSAAVTCFKGKDYMVNIPEQVSIGGKNYLVTSIADRAFAETSIKSITIPKSVVSIGKEAFLGCKLLKVITIPNSVTSIGAYAFYGCGSLKSITIPRSVTNIGEGAFYNFGH